jgi:uncharacterized protein
MQANILWTGREYYSLENCVVQRTASGVEINSSIIGMYNHQLYKVEYIIKTNENWETKFCEIKTQAFNKREIFILHKDSNVNWKLNGNTAAHLKGCIDVDIPITPFTNTLPINRLKLNIGESKQIKVVYLDILNNEIKSVHQRYTRLSETKYRYENVPNDFEAEIIVDEAGLVVDYPGLFVRTHKVESNY